MQGSQQKAIALSQSFSFIRTLEIDETTGVMATAPTTHFLAQEQDIISSLDLNNDNVLTVTTWDGTVNVYDINRYQGNEMETIDASSIYSVTHEYPILSSYNNSTIDSAQWFFGDVQGNLLMGDLRKQNLFVQKITLQSQINDENKAFSSAVAGVGICRLKGSQDRRSLITASWHGDLRVVDTRTLTTAAHTNTEKKIFAMDFNESSMKIYCTNPSNSVDIRDIRKLDKPYEVRESGLRDQVRDLKIMNGGEGYAQCSVAGRVTVDYFDESLQTKKYGFRCHRKNLKDVDYVYSVNSICFKPNSNIFFSGGSDGKVSMWDYQLKKRLKTLDSFNSQSVVKLACNEKYLVIACSDDHFKTDPVLTFVDKTSASMVLPSNLYIYSF